MRVRVSRQIDRTHSRHTVNTRGHQKENGQSNLHVARETQDHAKYHVRVSKKAKNNVGLTKTDVTRLLDQPQH